MRYGADMPIINVENAKIKTVAVEVKTLTISGRQLTLSVARQIPYEELINYESMTFKGLPWGHINYFWGDEKNFSVNEYLHVIWQKGSDLRRDVIQIKTESNNHLIEYFYGEIDRYRAAKFSNSEDKIAHYQKRVEEQLVWKEKIPKLIDLKKSLSDMPQLYIAV